MFSLSFTVTAADEPVDEDKDAALITKLVEADALENNNASVLPLAALAADNKLLVTIELVVVVVAADVNDATGAVVKALGRRGAVVVAKVLVRVAVAVAVMVEATAADGVGAIVAAVDVTRDELCENGFILDAGAADVSMSSMVIASKRTLR